MKYESIDEIYAANEKIRTRFKDLLSRLTPEQLAARPDGEKWSVQQIVEHIAMVDEGTSKICAKLLRKAQEAGQGGDSSVVMSENFLQKGVEIAGMKVEAPSMVQPSGEQSISESLAKLDETAGRIKEMRQLFETVGSAEFKFPHPFFGEITAYEWLALKGGHEMRHMKQIERLLEKVQ